MRSVQTRVKLVPVRVFSPSLLHSAEGPRGHQNHRANSATMDGTTNARTTRVTSRELDVLTLIGKGLSNTEIADELCISAVTVKSHIGRIFGKLDLRDRAVAIVYAYDNGIVAPR
jgi:DNA-binding NarL/FixJ family response regulator